MRHAEADFFFTKMGQFGIARDATGGFAEKASLAPPKPMSETESFQPVFTAEHARQLDSGLRVMLPKDWP